MAVKESIKEAAIEGGFFAFWRTAPPACPYSQPELSVQREAVSSRDPANKSSVFSAGYRTARCAKDCAVKCLDLFKRSESQRRKGLVRRFPNTRFHIKWSVILGVAVI